MCKSINLEEILNSDLENLTTDQLATRWLELKKAEKCMQDMRYEVEAMLHFKNVDDERLEGTITTETDQYKIKETRKLTTKVDAVKYEMVKDQLGSISPVRFKPELDVKIYKALEKANAELYKLCQSFVSVKSAKPSFSIESI